MTVMDPQKIREEKLQTLKDGVTVYAETEEFIRMLKRGIEREGLDVIIDKSSSGSWFVPNEQSK
ncbi:MAG TPA: hypothetical protein VK078_01205 [Pseudogracilibacillus sp.]|nr:hypothetical protein [Pseudogracilibacillus sp.]